MGIKINNREARLTAHRLINKYQYHSKKTGFLEWKDNTPQYVKDLDNEISITHENWNK